MASATVRPAINDSGAAVTIATTTEQATFVKIGGEEQETLPKINHQSVPADDCTGSTKINNNVNGNSISLPVACPTMGVKTATAGSSKLGSETSTKHALLILLTIFTLSLTALFYVYTSFPELEESERQYVKLPLDIEDAKHLGRILGSFKDHYYFQVLTAVFLTYIFLQTFAIPGSIFLSILSGFLFPFFLALVLVCTCSAIGATLCYLLSSLVGRRLLYKYFPEKANKWAMAVTKHRDHLFNYMLFLRMTPLLPNWFINLASPVIGVPIMPFAVGTFFGVAPPSFVAIQAGQTLNKLTSSSDAFSWNSVILLFVFALLSLLPVLFRNRYKLE